MACCVRVQIILGALLSTADTAVNLFMLTLLWGDGSTWFWLLLTSIVAGALLAAFHAAATSATRSAFAVFHLHHIFNAIQSLRAGEKTDEYIGGRLFQAVLEAGPSAVLKLYIVLVREAYDPVRIVSIGISVLAMASTLGLDTAPADATRAETLFIAMYCFCEVVATVSVISLFAFLVRGYVFIAAAVHVLLILVSWRWWSRSMTGRRCDLLGMGLFSAVLNYVATIHTGEDASFVYQCLPYSSDGPHFVRGGSQKGAFLGLAAVQGIARIGYLVGAFVHGGGDRLHRYIAMGMGCAFVLQHVALAAYWILWRKHHALKAPSIRHSNSGNSKTLFATSPPGGEGKETDFVNPVHRYSFGQAQQGLAVAVASW